MSGIFCLEGNWEDNLSDKSSVRPILELLESNNEIAYFHRQIGTEVEFSYYLSRWMKSKDNEYTIGYFAFHGEPGEIILSDKNNEDNNLTLEKIGNMLSGRCQGKAIYFGGCSSLDISIGRVEEFKHKTKATCVCGYKNDVEWITSAAFDLLLFDALHYYSNSPKRIGNYLNITASGLVEKLGFKIF